MDCEGISFPVTVRVLRSPFQPIRTIPRLDAQQGWGAEGRGAWQRSCDLALILKSIPVPMSILAEGKHVAGSSSLFALSPLPKTHEIERLLDPSHTPTTTSELAVQGLDSMTSALAHISGETR
jgi:hypothetical protein